MDHDSRDLRLMAFGLGTFHTALLVLVVVLPLYLTVDLGRALAELSTVVGIAIFGDLWLVSVYCTHRGLRDAGLRAGSSGSVIKLLNSGVTWGAWNGVLFLWSLLGAGTAVLLVGAFFNGGGAVLGVSVIGVIAVAIGTAFAAPIGAFAGSVFTAIDIGMLAAARWLVAPMSDS
jgi:hypothetical protein